MSDGRVFLCGALSGLVEGITVQPLELVKTRCQINEGVPMKLLPTFRGIIRCGMWIYIIYRYHVLALQTEVPSNNSSMAYLMGNLIKGWSCWIDSSTRQKTIVMN